MKEKPRQAKSDFQKTQFANLVRYLSSGQLFARFRVRGKLVRQCLETSDVSVGKRKLDDLMRQERCAVEKTRDGKMTIADAVAEYRLRGYRVRVGGDRSKKRKKTLKPRTKDYYEERIKKLLASWRDLEAMAIRSISKKDCDEWSTRFSKLVSASSYNHTISILRHLLQIGVDSGARYDNPAADLERVSEQPKELQLPEPSHFTEFVRHIRNAGGRFSSDCADLVEFLAFSGCRKGEAANVAIGDVDLKRGTIRIFGDPETRTKNGEIRSIPIVGDMRALLARMLAERKEESASTPLLRVNECQKAMDRAAGLASMDRITHHDLRHLFATTCIESGVDIPTVSKWLGHKDGGALAMRVYGHLRDRHSQEMAKMVNFQRNIEVIPQPQEKVV